MNLRDGKRARTGSPTLTLKDAPPTPYGMLGAVTPSKSAGPFDWSDAELSACQPDARKFWPDEVMDLTPWVIEHLDQVGQILGLQLEARTLHREVRFGSFRADIVVEDDRGRTVVIEVQLGPSDHDHFAKIVTYAFEASAEVVVWIVAGTGGRFRMSSPIRPEHQRALNHLNGVLGERVSFYGLSIELRSEPFKLSGESLLVRPRLQMVIGPDGPDLDGQGLVR